MNNRPIILFICWLVCSFSGFAQVKSTMPDLSKANNLQTINRNATLSADKQSKTVVHLDAKPGAGVSWIKGVNFTTGILEFDIKGKDVLQQSFVGVAFHAVNDSTYESIYFRPFNFQATDPVRKKHAVQYIFLPKFDWFTLRETYPDKYENALLNKVNPDDWFHVKIVVSKDSIQTFVNAEAQPCLVVQPLTPAVAGKIGFWVGNNSEGDFRNLSILPQ